MLSAAHSNMTVAVGIRGRHEEHTKLLLRPRHPDRQRFDLARMVGDHIGLDTEDTWKPATRSLTARQKFQRCCMPDIRIAALMLMKMSMRPFLKSRRSIRFRRALY